MARVLVTGVAGQIGSYVAEQLCREGHTVVGVVHQDQRVPDGVEASPLPLSVETIPEVLRLTAPEAVIHLAGQSSVAASWASPSATFDANARLTAALVFEVSQHRGLRFVHSSSAEIFGRSAPPVQNEGTPIRPSSPYGVSRAAGHMAVQVVREGWNAPVSNLICYVGESERRPPHFVFRKITRGLAEVALGRRAHVALGNTSAIRDFCHARDVAAAAIVLALEAAPGDYICASGEGHAVADVAAFACEYLNLDVSSVVQTDPALFRPTEIPSLVGDASKLERLGWRPTMNFRELVQTIVDFDLADLRSGA